MNDVSQIIATGNYGAKVAMVGETLVRCKDCPHGFARLVGSKGDPASALVIVGESPGKQEVKVGAPFVGPSGRVLEHALAQHPDIKDPLCLNAIQCYPGTNTKTQDKIIQATHCCQKRLLDAIRIHPRKVILALGNPAVWSTTGEFGTRITQIRGSRSDSPLSEFGIVATVHPAFLLRGGGSMRQFMADIDYACRLTKQGSGALKRYVVPEVYVLETAAEVRELGANIAKHEYCAADIETGGHSGFDHLRDRILSVAYCYEPSVVWIVPENLVPLTPHVYADAPNTRFIWHNGKFDQKFNISHGIHNARVDEDTMLLSYAIDETKGIHDLEQLSSDILGSPDWKFLISEYLKGKNKTYADVPKPRLYDYQGKDTSATLQIFPFLRNLVARDLGLEKLYTKTLLPMSNYLRRIEMVGIEPDLVQVKRNQIKKTAEADQLEREFNEEAIAAGHGVLNPRSPKQVAYFLYDVLKLRNPKYPKKRPDSTDEDTLLTLPPHPAVKCLLRYREVHKGLSTYVNSVEELVGKDGRIHTTYLIHGTTTGRLASRDPNLLNIPRDPELRGQFKAKQVRLELPNNEGQIILQYMLMEIDVNQAELRVLGDLATDEVLHTIYTDPKSPSIHEVTRGEMYGNPSNYTEADWLHYYDKFSVDGHSRVLEEQKMQAKNVNFGIVYGRTAPTFAEEFGVTAKEAQAWLDAWFNKYAGARVFLNRCRQAPLKGENLVTPFGRKRRFQIVNQEKLNDIQNQASNFPMQSIASDCVTHTGMRVQELAATNYDANIVNTVYDSILFELPDNIHNALKLGAFVLKTLRNIPREWGLSKIPFTGDLKIGTDWGHLEKVPLPRHLQKDIERA